MTYHKSTISVEKHRLISFALVLLLYYPLLNGGISSILHRFGLSRYQLLYLIVIALEALIIYGSVFICMQIDATTNIFSCIILLLLYLFNIVFYPANTSVLLESSRKVFLFCLPSFILASTIDSFDLFWEYLCKLAPFMIGCGIIYILFGIEVDPKETESYSMWFGYQMLIPVMISMWKFCNGSLRDKVLNFILFVIGLFMMIVRGSRGPIVVIIVYALVCIIRYQAKASPERDKTKKLIIKIGNNTYSIVGLVAFIMVLIVLVYVLLNVQNAAYGLYKMLLNHGYDSRTLRVLSIKNALQYTAGRDRIYNIAIRLIFERPILGYGLYGDCVQIGKALHVNKDIYSGYYAHNLVLGMFLHWGIPMGTFILLNYVYRVYMKFKKTTDQNLSNILILLCVYVGIQYIFSGNYFESSSFWMLFGLAHSPNPTRDAL